MIHVDAGLELAPEPDHEDTKKNGCSGNPQLCRGWARRMEASLDNPVQCDVVFAVGDKHIHALRHLCATHSCVLDMMFGDGWRVRCDASTAVSLHV